MLAIERKNEILDKLRAELTDTMAMWSVLGIGVALKVRTSTSFLSSLSFSF